MKKEKYETTKFEVNKKFYFEVVPNGECIDFAICDENLSMRVDVFSIPSKNCPENKWEEIIENSMEDSIRTFYRVYERDME